jgi:hypothetical protein
MSRAPRGGPYQRHYRIERNGFDGPIEVRLADRQARHLQGVTGPVITVPPGTDEFDYTIQLPPWIEMGRTSRTCVMATGVVRDADGSEHVVSFTSVNPNEQVVVVPGPGRLGLEVEPRSLALAPGGTAEVAVRVVRDRGVHGPVQLELMTPAHVRGLAAAPVVIPAERSAGTVTLRWQTGELGPGMVRLRATLTQDGAPLVAEARLEVVPAAQGK